jgi:hypothetical protein
VHPVEQREFFLDLYCFFLDLDLDGGIAPSIEQLLLFVKAVPTQKPAATT